MSLFLCSLLCTVALFLSNAYADEDEKTFEALIADCLKEYGVTLNDMVLAEKTGNISSMNPCFFSCYFKKLGFFNEKGEYDTSVYFARMAKYNPNFEKDPENKKFIERCESVKDAVVSDGEAGCERAELLLACLVKQSINVDLQ